MKKGISLILALVLCLSLCACGGSNDTPETGNTEASNPSSNNDIVSTDSQDDSNVIPTGPSEEDRRLVEHYADIVRALMDYTPNDGISVYISQLKKILTGNVAMEYIYNELQNLENVDPWLTSEYFSFEDNFPTDRLSLLNRFTILEDRLIKTSCTTVDNMGNTRTYEYEINQYYYDKAGNLTKKQQGDAYADSLWGDFFHSSGHYFFSYNDAGLVSEIKIGNNQLTEIYEIVTPSYDESGNLISEAFRNNSGEHTITYTYDNTGKCTQAECIGFGYHNYKLTYTYDDAGRLIQKDNCRFNGKVMDCLTTTIYSYSDKDTPDTATITITGYNVFYDYIDYQVVDTVSYSYDSNNHLIQEVWKYGDAIDHNGTTTLPTYRSKTIDYIYGNYYVFDPN